MPFSDAIGWTCDSCSTAITCIEDGWVEWLACGHGKSGRVEGLRLVHTQLAGPKNGDTGGCRYDGRREFRNHRKIVEGLSLDRFVGPDGLMLLLSFLASGEIAPDQTIELIKRVQIPGYERCSPYFQEAIDRGLMVPAIGKGYFLQSEIRTLLRQRAQEEVA